VNREEIKINRRGERFTVTTGEVNAHASATRVHDLTSEEQVDSLCPRCCSLAVSRLGNDLRCQDCGAQGEPEEFLAAGVSRKKK
jgi:hypothetical protein